MNDPNQQTALRQKILEIHALDIDTKEKSKRIQALMSRSLSSYSEISPTSQSKNDVSFHNEENNVLGCKHYARDCQIKASCCQTYFPCRLCHDEEVLEHKIDRFATSEIKCMLCKTEQPVSNQCISPDCPAHENGFAKYYCSVCKFF
ncbi:hypothetical protein GEMRC1_005592 [Eukaryota sp. GEM-RC1]